MALTAPVNKTETEADPFDPGQVDVAPPANSLLLTGRHVPQLDGLRGLAIILVLLNHFTPAGPSHTFLGTVTKAIAGAGSIGVDLFFVLSGFLITGILLDAKGAPRYFRTFYARRSLRIFPLYYGYLAVALILVPRLWPALSDDYRRILHDQGWLWLYASNIKGSFTALERPFTAGWLQMDHFWSLAVEEQFYLVWPLLVLLLGRRQMIGVCLLLIVGALGVRIYVRNDDSMAFYSFTLCRMDELATGALLALLARNPITAARLRRFALPTLIVTGGILLPIWGTDLRIYVLGGTLLGLFFGSMLILVVSGGPRSPLRRATAAAPMRLFGKYSYAMYVLHPFLLVVMNAYIPHAKLGKLVHSGPLGVVLFMLLGFAVTLAAGWLSWNLYEKHFLKLKRFFDYKQPARREVAEPLAVGA